MQAASQPPPDKSEWRQQFRKQLRAQPNPEEASAAIRLHLTHRLEVSEPLRIATFSALRGEADLSPLIYELPRHDWLFPRVRGNDLTFHRISTTSELQPGAMGILEPDGRLPVEDSQSIDLILCPGLGFGRDGSRLGRGRGFYDRTLSACRANATIIGIALPHQLVDAVPTEAHDCFMDQLATVDGLTPCPPR
ncbi:5-formyltetrahydrofolate cyclo-ligase [Haloferula rosea]|uniref:5-formyltetrahydrofolate cyclo-ligase n=1 Tax=Haloferula rosea TaxID=490093 RepID=A0A934VGM2_9BACT|nr:5-formyltetrahydrofolate cyclo-ligase [Haloferula rosea]MBK1827720.1 5-formyltetrahydrofolate cyclo-ligase [Haloferula rosea]